MNAPSIHPPLRTAAAECNPLLIAHEWLGNRLAQQSTLGPAARQVLQQLCCSAAVHCFDRGQRSGPLDRMLDKAGKLAEAVNRAFPDGDAGTVWLRAIHEHAQLRDVWSCYRSARELRSPALDRMLLEALICTDLRRAGLSAFGRPSSGPASAPPRADAASTLLTAAALILGWSWLQTTDPALTWHRLELPTLTALAGAAGLLFWNPRTPRALKAAPIVSALRQALSHESPDLGAVAAAMHTATKAGVVWSAETLQVLVRVRMNALPRPTRDR